MIELVAFLGNPGREYAGTRHNAGRLLAEKLPFYAELSWQKKFRGLYAALDTARLDLPAGDGPARLHFIIPETFMNNSGESVQAAAAFFKIPPERILAVHDELEMPLGMVGFKYGGGLGGHNGLRSLAASLSTPEFWRLRIGIGRPGDREPGKGGPQGVHGDIYGWVLSAFTEEEKIILGQVLSAAAAALAKALVEGPETLLSTWKKKQIVSD